jgi:hypothetical protein
MREIPGEIRGSVNAEDAMKPSIRHVGINHYDSFS